MPISTVTAMTAYDLPSEGGLGHQAILDQIASAKLSLRLFMYGWTCAEFADALATAHERGIDVKCLLDHTQAAGPSEVALLHRFWLRVPPALSRITTSPVHGAIMHRKVLVIDWDAPLPDAQFETVDQATEAGYPRTISGSTNWSPTAFTQVNDLLVIPGKSYAALVARQFDALWTWADANEAAYNKAS